MNDFNSISKQISHQSISADEKVIFSGWVKAVKTKIRIEMSFVPFFSWALLLNYVFFCTRQQLSVQ